MRWKSDFILLFVAAIWGTGFVISRIAAAQIDTFYYNGVRFLIAALVVLLAARFFQPDRQAQHPTTRREFLWMAAAGSLLFAAVGFQQAGLATTSIGNASFITGLYVVLVPLILLLIWRQPVSWLSWAAVGLAGLGITLLGVRDELRLAPGDVLELAGAFLWAMHVVLVGWLARRNVNVMMFSAVQFVTCGVFSLALAFSIAPAGAASLLQHIPLVIYSAVFPIGLGFTLQIAAQKYAPPVDAAIIMSMEAVFGTLFGYLFLKEVLDIQQLLGCSLVLAAMILSQLNGAVDAGPVTAADEEPASTG